MGFGGIAMVLQYVELVHVYLRKHILLLARVGTSMPHAMLLPTREQYHCDSCGQVLADL